METEDFISTRDEFLMVSDAFASGNTLKKISGGQLDEEIKLFDTASKAYCANLTRRYEAILGTSGDADAISEITDKMENTYNQLRHDIKKLANFASSKEMKDGNGLQNESIIKFARFTLEGLTKVFIKDIPNVDNAVKSQIRS